MDTRDVSEDDDLVTVMKRIEASFNETMKRKGQLVHDHPSPTVVVSSFMLKLLAKSVLQPAGNLSMPITTMPAPYPPSAIPAQDLEPLPISQMRLETHHPGKKVMLRVLTPPDRITVVMAVVEDEEGTAVLLQLYQQLEEEIVPCSQTILPHAVCIVKEPLFTKSVDGAYSLRVDHLGDIIWLADTDERIPQEWRGRQPRLNDSSRSIRAQGNDFVKDQKWAAALRSYSSAIKTAETLEDEQLASLNRSLVNLKLDRPTKALSDAIQGQDPATPREKSIFRQAQALYRLCEFEKCLETLQTLMEAFPNNQAAQSEMDRVKARLKEQNNGEYSFARMYKQSQATPPLMDCATFSVPVEIRDSPGRGRGLLTTKPVRAGDLLLCEKAFSYYFIDEKQPDARRNVLMNLSTKKSTMGGAAHLLPQIAQKLYHDPQLMPLFQDLYHDDYKVPAVVECDGAPVVDSFLVEKIISLNAFGPPRTSLGFLKDQISTIKDSAVRDEAMFSPSGIWLIASRINHSCVGNCRRSFIGDMQIVRATTDMAAGTELSFFYRPPDRSESYEEVQKHLKTWGFVCRCELCKDRSNTSATVLRRRQGLCNDLKSLLKTQTSPFDLVEAERLLKGAENTYQGRDVGRFRLELPELYLAIGYRYSITGRWGDAAKSLRKALEALGFSIRASPPHKPFSEPWFEVKRWGVATENTTLILLRLVDVYEQLAPELCQTILDMAKLSYSMIVGEKWSFDDMLTELS
ncbi:hypothetical protein F66182_2837 [Fusarium sp. NRRL 66182]|nr:hypothetical protein F66182_2837 [Fusarium sp. NRRL 66182]